MVAPHARLEYESSCSKVFCGLTLDLKLKISLHHCLVAESSCSFYFTAGDSCVLPTGVQLLVQGVQAAPPFPLIIIVDILSPRKHSFST